MNLIIYSVYDKAIQAYMRPFFFQSDGQALRSFIDEVNREGSEMYAHPEDYALFRIGQFDANGGEVQPEISKCIGKAHELKNDIPSNVTSIQEGQQ